MVLFNPYRQTEKVIKMEIKNYSISVLEKDFSENLQIFDIRKCLGDEQREIKIITGNDDFDALEQEWNKLAWESDTLIFQTFEWNRIWWKHFGTNKKLYIMAVYIKNKLAGIAPLFKDDVTLFGCKVYTSLRFLGSYVRQPEGEPLLGNISYSDYLNCIIDPEYEEIFYTLILKHFKGVMSDFDEIVLDEISEESTILNTMIPILVKSNYGLSYKSDQASSSPIIQLDSTWNEYLKSLNAKDRYNARRYYKRSKQGKKKVFNIEKLKHADDLPGVQSDFIRLHQQQWNNRGFAGTFSEQRMRDFFMEISNSFYEKDWIEFNMAVPEEVDEKYVAIDVIMTYKNRLYLLHRGMGEEPFYRRKGPGNVLLYARLNEAINDGVNIFDMLRGSEEFKLKMATKINQNKKVIVCSDSPTRKLQTGLVNKTMTMIHHVRTEKSHIKHHFNEKPLFKGLTEYIQFLQRRIKHKLYA